MSTIEGYWRHDPSCYVFWVDDVEYTATDLALHGIDFIDKNLYTGVRYTEVEQMQQRLGFLSEQVRLGNMLHIHETGETR